ncbi:MAG: response regulator transcription factor [Anaerolineales bacterium]|nr:response regulator transcription factor [Anaerolineales bacterium]
MLPLRVLIVDDHRLFRQGLISIMNTRPDLIEVAGEAAGGREAIRLVDQLRPDVILLDIFMPDLNGLQTAKVLRQSHPETAIIMLTSSEEDQHLFEAVNLGAAGYLLKNLDAAELFDLLEGVARGEAAMTRAMAGRLLKGVANRSFNQHSPVQELTEREIEVLKLVARGCSNSQIAEQLYISINTVKSHLKNILGKLQLENRTQVAAFAVQAGLITPLTKQDKE